MHFLSNKTSNHHSSIASSVPGDNRPYAKVTIFHKPFNCLLDSGSNNSICGAELWSLVKDNGLKLQKHEIKSIRTADKTIDTVKGAFFIPLQFDDVSNVLCVLSVPTLPQKLLLGIDFWKVFRLTIQSNSSNWCCALASTSKITPTHTITNKNNLSKEECCVLERTITKFKELGSGRLGRTNVLKHHIDTGDSQPVWQRQYPVSPAVQERMGKEILRMKEMDVIEPAQSPWCSPVVMVKKKNGKDRLCVDSRRLNKVTKRSRYALPHISAILNRLGKTRFLSSIDLKDAFWQVPLTESSKEKTAFNVPGHGMWQFKCLPFGLHNSAATMQKLMDILFNSEEHKVFVYLDDLIIATENFDEHIGTLEIVAEKLKMANLTINFEKCHFGMSSLKYLGFVVDENGLRTDPEKVETIINFPRPNRITEVRRFLGLASWYRRFVPGFAEISSPLNELTKKLKKGKSFLWNDLAEQAFLKLKTILTTAPVLSTPDYSKPFYLQCDASNHAVGAVLVQKDDENNDRPIAFISRKLRGAEVNYTVTEK